MLEVKIVIIIILKLVLSFLALGAAAYFDFKTHLVPDKLWLIYGSLGLGLSLFDLVLFSSSAWLSFAISAGVTISLALALFYIGGFGGADSKALICLAVCLPTAPFTPLLNAGGLLPFEMGFFPLIVFVDMLFLACLSVVYFAARNTVYFLRGGQLFKAQTPVVRRLVWFFTGFKTKVLKGSEVFWVKPLEAGEGEVWVSSGLPMLVFLFAGFVFALLFGNIFWLLLSSF